MQENKKFDIKITASLSKLDVSGMDEGKLSEDMQSILSVAEEICAHNGRAERGKGAPVSLNELRVDKACAVFSREEMLKSAKTAEGGYITLPTATVKAADDAEG